jgi:pimeloyl-ACP methyl ester carboxylesterase
MAQPTSTQPYERVEHWTNKGELRLFLWEKYLPTTPGAPPAPDAPILVLVHGSSMASQPSFDLDVPGRPEYNFMDFFVERGYDVWTFDCEGYGLSDKRRDITFDIATGADDCAAVMRYIAEQRGNRPVCLYGVSSGALRAAMYAEREPERVRKLALHAFVWTGEGSPTLVERRKRLPEYIAGGNRRPMDAKFIESIFTRDHPGVAEPDVVEVFARAVVELDDSVPIGTYVDMCSHLPVVDPTRITVPTLVTRGEYDGIAGLHDLLSFYERLATTEKQFSVLPGLAHSSAQEKNHAILTHVLHGFFSQPEPIYRGS